MADSARPQEHLVAHEFDGYEVRLLIGDCLPIGFKVDGRIPESIPMPRWLVAGEASEETIRRVFCPKPVVHVIPGLRSTRAWEGDDRTLHLFMSPKDFHRAQTTALFASDNASVQAHVWYEPGKQP